MQQQALIINSWLYYILYILVLFCMEFIWIFSSVEREEVFAVNTGEQHLVAPSPRSLSSLSAMAFPHAMPTPRSVPSLGSGVEPCKKPVFMPLRRAGVSIIAGASRLTSHVGTRDAHCVHYIFGFASLLSISTLISIYISVTTYSMYIYLFFQLLFTTNLSTCTSQK